MTSNATATNTKSSGSINLKLDGVDIFNSNSVRMEIRSGEYFIEGTDSNSNYLNLFIDINTLPGNQIFVKGQSNLREVNILYDHHRTAISGTFNATLNTVNHRAQINFELKFAAMSSPVTGVIDVTA